MTRSFKTRKGVLTLKSHDMSLNGLAAQYGLNLTKNKKGIDLTNVSKEVLDKIILDLLNLGYHFN